MTDFLENKRSEIRTRLDELTPIVEEYHRLEEAAQALDGVGGASAGVAPSAAAPRRRGRPRRPRGSKARAASTPTGAASTSARERSIRTGIRQRGGRRKGSGTRGAQALSFIQGQPGITIPELATKMGTHPTYLYKVLPSLQKDGKVVKEGRGWRPTEA